MADSPDTATNTGSGAHSIPSSKSTGRFGWLSGTKALVIIIILAIIAIVLACMLLIPAGGSNGAAAKIGDTYISEADVTKEITTMREDQELTDNEAWKNYLQSLGYTPAYMREQTIESLEDAILIEQGAKQLGVSVSDSDVDKELAQEKENGGFEENLAALGLTESAYKEQLRSSLLQEAVSEKLAANSGKQGTSDEQVVAALGEVYEGPVKLYNLYSISIDTSEDSDETTTALQNGTISFEDAAKQLYGSLEEASMGWMAADDLSSNADVEAITATGQGQMSSGVVDSEDKTVITYYMWTDSYDLPYPVETLDGMPDSLKESLREATEEIDNEATFASWLSGIRSAIDITIYAMPSGLPYDVK